MKKIKLSDQEQAKFLEIMELVLQISQKSEHRLDLAYSSSINSLVVELYIRKELEGSDLHEQMFVDHVLTCRRTGTAGYLVERWLFPDLSTDKDYEQFKEFLETVPMLTADEVEEWIEERSK